MYVPAYDLLGSATHSTQQSVMKVALSHILLQYGLWYLGAYRGIERDNLSEQGRGVQTVCTGIVAEGRRQKSLHN